MQHRQLNSTKSGVSLMVRVGYPGFLKTGQCFRCWCKDLRVDVDFKVVVKTTSEQLGNNCQWKSGPGFAGKC